MLLGKKNKIERERKITKHNIQVSSGIGSEWIVQNDLRQHTFHLTLTVPDLGCIRHPARAEEVQLLL